MAIIVNNSIPIPIQLSTSNSLRVYFIQAGVLAERAAQFNSGSEEMSHPLKT